jgi:hypothetical protein
MHFMPASRAKFFRTIFIFMAIVPLLSHPLEAREDVILLHGLCRTSRSMSVMARALTQAGYNVHNINYPSRSASVENLSEEFVGKAVADCKRDGAVKINFVTHSLGGILVRSYLANHSVPALGRVVMLGPPNQGSEVVDRLGGWWLFKKINGPVGNELGTGKDSMPNRLGAANFCVGIIAGNRTINWINSLMIPGSDDGKVSVARTRLAGMTDHIVIPSAHPFLMRNATAIRQTIYFLRNGKFDRTAA